MQLFTGTFQVIAAGEEKEVTVATWEELEKAVNSGNNITITLEEDVAANKTVTIPKGKTVTIKGNKTVYRNRDSKYLSMFNVEKGGTLNLDNGVTLSAKSMSGGGKSNCRLLKGWDQE